MRGKCGDKGGWRLRQQERAVACSHLHGTGSERGMLGLSREREMSVVPGFFFLGTWFGGTVYHGGEAMTTGPEEAGHMASIVRG